MRKDAFTLDISVQDGQIQWAGPWQIFPFPYIILESIRKLTFFFSWGSWNNLWIWSFLLHWFLESVCLTSLYLQFLAHSRCMQMLSKWTLSGIRCVKMNTTTYLTDRVEKIKLVFISPSLQWLCIWGRECRIKRCVLKVAGKEKYFKYLILMIIKIWA